MTIQAPKTHYKPDSDVYRTSADIGKMFDVRRSMVKGDGLFAAPAFLCFKDGLAQARFVVSRPDLYDVDFVKECENRLKACSSKQEVSFDTHVSSSLSA